MLIITILSLLMAATMGWLALRLLRDDQRRSEARVAALSAALETPGVDHRDTYGHEGREPVPAPARVERAAVAPPPEIVDLDETEGAVFFSPPPVEPPLPPPHLREDDRPMFGDAPAETAPARDSRHWLGIAAAVVAFVLGVAGVRMVWSSSAEPAGSPVTGSAHTTAATSTGMAAAGIPVELVSLGHERTPDALIIRGLVRNPAAASPRTGTSASVFLFDGEGGFLGSGRAVLGTPKLGAGDEAAFEVRLPDNPRVRRYRVTFRSPEGDVVPHLDRRTPSGSGLSATNSGSGLATR